MDCRTVAYTSSTAVVQARGIGACRLVDYRYTSEYSYE